MSAVKVNEYTPVNFRKGQARILAERTQMLLSISRKAQERTLTLQETNDLYAEFNKTYEQHDRVIKARGGFEQHDSITVGADGVDESWALKLLKESEKEDNTSIHTSKNTRYRARELCDA
mgnify:CR=1 FL=1